MGKSKTTSTQNTTQALPAGQQRNVDTLMSEALKYFNSGGREFFPGDVVADFDPLQTQGQNQLVDYAGGAGQDFVNSALSGNQFFMDPQNIMNPENMPGFMGSVEGVTSNLTNNLLRNILPSVRGGGTSTGQFGGTPQGIGEALSVGETNRHLGDTLSNMYLGAYGQGLDMFNQAQNRAPGLFNMGAMPGQIIAGVGDARQNQAQAEIEGNVARHDFNQNEPIAQLELLRNLTGQYGQYGGTSNTTNTQTTSSSPITQALGGALSFASMFNPTMSLFSGLGGGKGAGGLGRALMRGLS